MRAAIVYEDRTPWTLAAHTYALEQLSLMPAGTVARLPFDRIGACSPTTIAYIDAPQAALEQRSSSRADFPALLVSPTFNAAFREFFLVAGQEHGCPTIQILDGSKSREAVAQALSEVSQGGIDPEPALV